MNQRLSDTVRSTIFLKATSFIIGLLFWSIMSSHFPTSMWLTVPVCFYNQSDKKIDAPEAIMVELHGKRAHLRNLDRSACAIHIDAQTLSQGPNLVTVTPDLLFLPTTIQVSSVIPHNLLVKVAQ